MSVIHQTTTLVVGAGGSEPYGFPVGSDLMKWIVRDTDPGNRHSSQAKVLMDAGASETDLDTLHNKLKHTHLYSIDLFLERWPELLDVGKLAIAAELIPCERQEYLDDSSRNKHWYRFLFNSLIEAGSYSGSKLSVVTLNYDRSIEQYLYTVLQNDERMTAQQAMMAVAKIDFVHLHGHLGALPWQPQSSDTSGPFVRAYSPELTPGAVVGAAKGLRIVSDPMHIEHVDLLERARVCLRSAEMIGFIGFGYNDVMLDRLQVKSLRHSLVNGRPRQYFGSAQGLHHGKKKQLSTLMPGIELGEPEHDALAFLGSSRLLYQVAMNVTGDE